MIRSPAEEAVVRAVVARGYLTQAQLDEALAGSSAGTALARLAERLSETQIADLRGVYDAALAGGTLPPARLAQQGTLPPTRGPADQAAPPAPAAPPTNQQREQATLGPAPAPAPSVAPTDLPLPSALQPLVPGDRIGSCRIERELARGGMGIVYVAEQVALGRRVAVKLLLSGVLPDPGQVDRFRLEAEATAKLRHPNIVAVHEVGTYGRHHYMVMDLVEGESLDRRLERDGPLDPLLAARLVADLAGALQHAHEMGVLHRDLKPSNVLLAPSGAPLLTDFGLARLRDANRESLTKTGEVLGTPAFMPPEQATGEGKRADARADVYSLGATLHALLTGDPPFAGGSLIQILAQIAGVEPPRASESNPAVPSALDAIVLKCLEKRPEDRYPDAEALREDLERFLAGDTVEARLKSVWPLRLAGVATLVFTVLGILLVWRATRPVAPPQPAAIDKRQPRPTEAATAAAPTRAPAPSQAPSQAPSPTALQTPGTRTWLKDDWWRDVTRSWVQRAGPSAPPARTLIQDAMTYDPDRKVVWLFGGHGGAKAPRMDDLWSWDGQVWRPQPRTQPWPPGRTLHSLCYDRRRKRLVLFGGEVAPGRLTNAVWEYDGTTWTRKPPTSRPWPSPRYAAASAFEARRGTVTVFSGNTGAGELAGELWEWDGSVWGQRSPPGRRPGPRQNGGLVFDPAGGRLRLYGGIGPKGWKRSLWALGPDRWELPSKTAEPDRREGHAMVQGGKALLVFSGKSARGDRILRDTWLYRAGTWHNVVPSASPPARCYGAAAYDGSRKRVVIFGGSLQDGAPWERSPRLGDTWEYALD